MKSLMCALEMTEHAPAEFQLHRRRRRDERFGENIDKAPKHLTFALIAHTATCDDVIDARRRTRTHPRVFSSRITGFQSHRPRSPNTRRRFASSNIGSCAKIGDDSERAVAGVARRDEAVNDAARAGRVGSKHSDRKSTLVSAV